MTISRTNFIAISVTMITILILFQFSNLSATYTSEAMKNKNAEKDITLTVNDTIQKENLQTRSSYSTAIIGSPVNRESNLALEWCVYTKRSFYRFSSLDEFSNNSSRECTLLITSADYIDDDKDVKLLLRQAKAGVNVILTSMPETAFIRDSDLFQQLSGIRRINRDSFKIKALTMYEGFLLGGKATYRKIKRTLPYFQLSSGTKTYVIGEVRDQKTLGIKNEDLPPIVWRNHIENGFVFCTNFDFFKDHTGLGMFTSMLSETQKYYIYPIVNAQNIIFQNFPYFSSENDNVIPKEYYYSGKALCENVLWPDVVSILSATGDKFSGMSAPKLEYGNSSMEAYSDALTFYFEQNEKITGELGLSGDQLDGYNYYDEKIKYDTDLMERLAPEYRFTVFSPGNMPESVYRKYLDNPKDDSILADIRTVILPKSKVQTPLLSFYNDDIIRMTNTIDGFSHTNEEDIYIRSIETALGYSSVSVDFTRVLYPSGKKDDWTKLSKNLSRFLDTYWASFRNGFKQVTASETDTRIRNFFAVNYNSFRRENTINLSIYDNMETSFMLNLNNERIIHIEGADYTEIEHGRYVLSATEQNVTIEVTPDNITQQ